MPGKDLEDETDRIQSSCRRCHDPDTVVTVRTEPLCKGCFQKYITTKVVKRMESFRVRHVGQEVQQTLLLPLSLGRCSTALLQILSQHLQGQVAKSGRRGYRLLVLHIDDGSLEEAQLWTKVQKKFPDHEYVSRPLSDVVALDSMSGLLGHVQREDASAQSENEQLLQSFLASHSSPSSRADIIQLLRRRLIVQIAKDLHCDAIVWGDSTTRLAERTLAETAKGRGSSVPWSIADGPSPQGLAWYYPLRDVLSKEITAYATLAEPPFNELVMSEEEKPAINTKNSTIDDLMRQYFASVEQEHPSVVANVVRTTAKLQPPSLDEVERHCELCEMPLEGQSPAKSRLCYGCIRTWPAAAG